MCIALCMVAAVDVVFRFQLLCEIIASCFTNQMISSTMLIVFGRFCVCVFPPFISFTTHQKLHTESQLNDMEFWTRQNRISVKNRFLKLSPSTWKWVNKWNFQTSVIWTQSIKKRWAFPINCCPTCGIFRPPKWIWWTMAFPLFDCKIDLIIYPTRRTLAADLL